MNKQIEKGMKYTLCVPAEIRKCKGIVIETLTSAVERKNMIATIKELESRGYHIYGLRHPDNDMSKPASVKSQSVLVNRFGWFITKDEMKFNKSNEVMINRRNAVYYSTSRNEWCDYFWLVDAISVNEYLEKVEDKF